MHPADFAEFETRLLAAAPGTTATGFASKARCLREGTHPETLITRVRQAISTRTARAQQGPNEHRTLGQLRADTATALLLGQHPFPGSGNPEGRTLRPQVGAWRTARVARGVVKMIASPAAAIAASGSLMSYRTGCMGHECP
ncbi:hypothetical protein [Arthrobacter alpinus]|nr:hypothetical protein [Arthrobacter alpinus]